MLKTNVSREDALALLMEYNKDPFHIVHGLTVEGVMRYFADDMGYADEADFWAMAGLLHDVDYGTYPSEHLQHSRELMEKIGAEDELIHAVESHGYGICSDVEPEHDMEKILFAADELTGLIWAGVLVRPSRSTKDMEVKSIKKKFKDKHFAAGCNREIIKTGIERLGWEQGILFEKTLTAMQTYEDFILSEIKRLNINYQL